MAEVPKPHSFYITTAIHYANAGPHLGHAYEAVLADIVARYWRGRGVETFFLSGTDEHGDKILRAASKAGKGPQAFVDGNAALFRDLYEDLCISNDAFIRTSDRKVHWPGVEAMWKAIEAKGDIYKDTYRGLYCVGCEAFLTEKELVDGKCPSHQAEPETVEEDNYFFRLSRYGDTLRDIIEKGEYEILPHGRKNEILALLDQGVEDVSFSRPERDIPWGIPVPGDAGQNVYVWCDALTNYVSALGYGRTDDAAFRSFWPAQAHVVGKDIARFHAVIWPAMLLSAGLPLPERLWIHGFITSGGVKMSKSIGNVIDPKEYIDRYGADAFRYYLGREISPFEDGDFTKERFEETYNANLANGLGNLISRTTKMASQYFDGKVTRALGEDVPLSLTRASVVGDREVSDYTVQYAITNDIVPRYHAHMEEFQIQNAADAIWEVVGILDGYIASHEPYKLIKTDSEKAENVIYNVLLGIDIIREMLSPFMPETADAIGSLVQRTPSAEGVEDVFRVRAVESPLFARL